MPLFWIVHEVDGARVVMKGSGALIYARLHAARIGFTGTFVEAHALDQKTAKKLPKRMIRAARFPSTRRASCSTDCRDRPRLRIRFYFCDFLCVFWSVFF